MCRPHQHLRNFMSREGRSEQAAAAAENSGSEASQNARLEGPV